MSGVDDQGLRPDYVRPQDDDGREDKRGEPIDPSAGEHQGRDRKGADDDDTEPESGDESANPIKP